MNGKRQILSQRKPVSEKTRVPVCITEYKSLKLAGFLEDL